MQRERKVAWEARKQLQESQKEEQPTKPVEEEKAAEPDPEGDVGKEETAN